MSKPKVISEIIVLFYENMPLGLSIRQGLTNAILATIASGAVNKNKDMPTLNQVSASMGISINTIQSAYDECENLGYIKKQRGLKAVVTISREDALNLTKENTFIEISRGLVKLYMLEIEFEKIEKILKEINSDVQKEFKKTAKKKTAKTETPS